MADQTLTHDELWDDSALVTSWNDAFDEYKKYHSLASRGEKVELQQDQPKAKSKAEAYLANGASKSTPSNTPINFKPGPQAGGTSMTAPPNLATIPQALIGGAQNEHLKNIMMSWYYAGYYTGLYEGQQKAYAEIQLQQQQEQDGMEELGKCK